MAAGRYRDDLIADADAAAALGRPAQPGPWAKDVHDAVGGALPALLSRWDTEPPCNQIALAALAALFPHEGQVLREHIASLAARQAGTQAGAYADLACQLIAGNPAALARAHDIYAWNDDLTEFDIDDELTEPELRAQRILSDAVVATLARARA